MKRVFVLAAILAANVTVSGAVNVTASRDYVDRKVTAVSNAICAAISTNYATRAEMNDGWWSEWTVLRDGTNVTAQVSPPLWIPEGAIGPADTKVWFVGNSCISGDETSGFLVDGPRTEYVGDLAWSAEDAVGESVSYTATRHRVAAPIPTKTSDLTNDSGFLTQHQQLAPVYSQTPTFSEWTIVRDGEDVTSQVQQPKYIKEDEYGEEYWRVYVADGENPGPDQFYEPLDINRLTWSDSDDIHHYIATRVRTDIIGYTLGAQTDKPLQPKGDYALLRHLYAAVRNLAPNFTKANNTYALNDLCTYNGVFYRCKSAYMSTAVSDTPDEDTTHWEAKKVSEIFLPLTGGTMTGDLQVRTHVAVGTMDFSTGGNENFGVGHDHKFFGKESFAVHDGNRVGAKGFYWKAIDTTAKKIYLTKTQPKPDSRCLPIGSIPGTASFTSTGHAYDSPYFGPKADSEHQELFVAESGIGLSSSQLAGKYITLVNVELEWFTRCFKVVSVEDGSVINYQEVKTDIPSYFYHTLYRKATPIGGTISYHDNQYVIFFPEMDQSKITCDTGSYVTSTSFGVTALGDANHVMGYNSFASGNGNRVESSYGAALGYKNEVRENEAVALGAYAVAEHPRTFVWSSNHSSLRYSSKGEGSFNINPAPQGGSADPLTGVFIGDTSLADRLNGGYQPKGDYASPYPFAEPTWSEDNGTNVCTLASSANSQVEMGWTCTPPLPNGVALELTPHGWKPSGNGANGAPKGNEDSQNLSWSAEDWSGGYSFTATRPPSAFTVSVADSFVTNTMRDLWLVVKSEAPAPAITWDSSIDRFEGGNAAAIAPTANATNIYHLYEYENGHFAVDKQGYESSGGYVYTTHSELVSMRSSGTLIPGQQYRITDYVATSNGDMDSRSANHPFDLIVTADGTNDLSESARAIQHEGDTHFNGCNLAAWQIQYCLDNDTNRFAWADSANGKGVIYRMVDEFNNDVPYDFKGILFRRIIEMTYSHATTTNWYYTFSSHMSTPADNSLDTQNFVVYNLMKPYYITGMSSKIIKSLNANILVGIAAMKNVFGVGCYSNLVYGQRSAENTFGNFCHDINIGVEEDASMPSGSIRYNVFGSQCRNITMGAYCQNNIFGDGCRNINLLPDNSANVLGAYCRDIRIGYGYEHSGLEAPEEYVGNRFGTFCSNIEVGNYSLGNKFGDLCSYIKFGAPNNLREFYRYITIESGNQYIYLDAPMSSYGQHYQNVTLRKGVNNTTQWLTITDANTNQTFETIYQSPDTLTRSVSIQ